MHVACENCRVVMKELSCFANTLLNNYSKDKCKDIITSNVPRKLAICSATGLHCSQLIVGLLYIYFG